MNMERAFELILRLYPQRFRDRFEPELRTLHSSQTDASRGEQVRFLGDLILGGVAERLQSMTWVRFATAICLFALGLFLLSMTLWTLGQNQVGFYAGELDRWVTSVLLSPVLAVVDLGWLLFPLALISRLQRPPTRLEWWSVLALVSIIVLNLTAMLVSGDVTVRQTLGALFHLSVILYSVANLRSSSPWLRTLKVALLVNGVVQAGVTWLPPYTLSLSPVWNAFRLAVVLAVIVGLVVNDTPRATATPAARG